MARYKDAIAQLENNVIIDILMYAEGCQAPNLSIDLYTGMYTAVLKPNNFKFGTVGTNGCGK